MRHIADVEAPFTGGESVQLAETGDDLLVRRRESFENVGIGLGVEGGRKRKGQRGKRNDTKKGREKLHSRDPPLAM
jgi:hypothetical protein